MYLTVIFLPLISVFLFGLHGWYYGRVVSALVATILMFCSFLISLFIWYEVGLNCSPVIITLYSWLDFSYGAIKIGFLFDFLTCTMLVIITCISFFVHLYSIGYMSNDPFLTRFMVYLSFFTFWMMFLVSADNFLQMFIGWEGVGLCSYLLINFWFTRIQANKAALKAMIVNRIADVFFILAIVVLSSIFKTLDYVVIFNLVPYSKILDFVLGLNGCYYGLELITFFLLIGALGKSAQIGLHVWLPDAMEGPTPVSALLHAATMVTAGVFLIIRCSPLFEYTPRILVLVTMFGGLTMIIASLAATCQYDIKKVIAYSTCSQLGYMFVCCGYSQYNIALFHLYNHAFFKALPFLGAGVIIHSCLDEQDIRYYGGLLNFLPFTYICMLIGSLAIVGFPFLTGFYSKELILEVGVVRYLVDAYFIYFLAVWTAANTMIYSWRLLFFVFFHSANFNRLNIDEFNVWMFLSLFFLPRSSIFIGYISSEFMVGIGIYNHIVGYVQLPINNVFMELECLSCIWKNFPLIISMLALFLAQVVHKFINNQLNNIKIGIFFGNIINFFLKLFYHAFFFNVVYNRLFLIIYKNSYIVFTKNLDKGFIEFFGPYGLYKLFFRLSLWFRILTPSSIFFSIAYTFFFIIFIFYFLFFCHLFDIVFISILLFGCFCELSNLASKSNNR